MTVREAAERYGEDRVAQILDWGTEISGDVAEYYVSAVEKGLDYSQVEFPKGLEPLLERIPDGLIALGGDDRPSPGRS